MGTRVPVFANNRRWIRQAVDLPVRVFAASISDPIPGRGTELSAGGMALYAGLELKTAEMLEIEFVVASRARLAGVVRNRQGYCFGLEFVTPLSLDPDSHKSAHWPGTQIQVEPGPLSHGAYELFQKIKAARGNAAAYALLAEVLLLAGRREEARLTAGRALTFLRHHNSIRRRQREHSRQEVQQQLYGIRADMALVAELYADMDPRLPGCLAQLRRKLQTEYAHKKE